MSNKNDMQKNLWEVQYRDYSNLVYLLVNSFSGMADQNRLDNAECARKCLILHPYFLEREERMAKLAAEAPQKGVEPECFLPDFETKENKNG